MKKNTHISAFTLVELVVVATILIILATIGFAAYSDNIPDARDAERKASFANVQAAMNLYKKER
jgi:type II secretory pathway pseudopilin PulG|tara:strand:- start:89 stop:280 length:192 start_codon:yes stop_codon:yes gene_type:complete